MKGRAFITTLFAFLAIIFQYLHLSGQEVYQLKPTNPQATNYFGSAVDISENFIVVGASREGAAYVYQKVGAQWVETQKLSASDGFLLNRFGTSISIDDTLLAVGAISDDDNGYNSGSVYIYVYDGTTWNETYKVLSSDGGPSDRYGSSVDIDSNRLIVGAIFANNLGSAYLYEYGGQVWNEVASVNYMSTSSANSFIGTDVAISGDRAFVGSPNNWDDCGNFATGLGRVYAYEFDNGSWSLSQVISPLFSGSVFGFGMAIDIHEDHLVIGAPCSNFAGMNSGTAYLFKYEDTSWVQKSLLFPAGNVSAEDNYGLGIAVHDEVIVVGAYRDEGITGSAYLLQNSVNSISLMDQFIPMRFQGGFFGHHIAVLDSTVVIGAWGNDNVNIYELGVPANAECDSANWITCGERQLGHTKNGKVNPGLASCNGSNLSSGPGSWYQLLGTGENFIVSLCGSSFDTQIGVFTNDCDSLICIAANDDACELQSRVQFPTNAGQVYYLFVTGYQTETGTFQIIIDCCSADAPVNSSTNVTTTTASLQWNALPGVDGYRIQGGVFGGPVIELDQSAGTTNLALNNLIPNTSYVWRVAGICNLTSEMYYFSTPDNTLSTYSEIDTFTTDASCFPPDSISSTNITNTSVILNWNAAASATGYIIYGNQLGAASDVALSVNNPASTSFTVNNLQPNTAYSWRMVSMCGVQLSTFTDRDTFATLPANQEAKYMANNPGQWKPSKVMIYPNPATDNISIEYGDYLNLKNVRIELLNLDGKLVLSRDIEQLKNPASLTLPDYLPPGMYHIRIINEDIEYSQKLILNK